MGGYTAKKVYVTVGLEGLVEAEITSDELKEGDIIIKLVSMLPKPSSMEINLGDIDMKGYSTTADLTVMSGEGDPNHQRDWGVNETKPLEISARFSLTLPKYSFSIIRIKKIQTK